MDSMSDPLERARSLARCLALVRAAQVELRTLGADVDWAFREEMVGETLPELIRANRIGEAALALGAR